MGEQQADSTAEGRESTGVTMQGLCIRGHEPYKPQRYIYIYIPQIYIYICMYMYIYIYISLSLSLALSLAPHGP